MIMKILSIIAQKPSSTGSGVYLSELVRCFKEMGHEQEIICAVYEGDVVGANINVAYTVRDDGVGANEDIVGANACGARSMGELHEPHYNKIIFNTKELPIKIAGMSDVMPYESMRYSELANDEKKLSLWMEAFDKKVREVLERFKPDLIICHHLYLLTALAISIINENGLTKFAPTDAVSQSFAPTKPKVYGICHNTDLRQYQQTNLKREFIKENIAKLDKTFFPSEEHAKKAIELYDLDRKKVEIIGIGYNNNIFKNRRGLTEFAPTADSQSFAPTADLQSFVPAADSQSFAPTVKKLLYVGKVAKKKGVLSLVKAINILKDENIVLDIIGGAGDKEEYEEILGESKKSISKINFLSPMTQEELAIEYNSHDIFILPSFSEGIPMVPLEAMACGCKVVISDLPGVKNFYNENVEGACIKYVKLPKLTNVDEATKDELLVFEKNLASAIIDSINDSGHYEPNLSKISWENIARKVSCI